MTTRRSLPTENTAPELHLTKLAGETDSSAIARAACQPEVQAAITSRAFSGVYFPSDLSDLVSELAGQVRAVGDGDLTHVEGLLLAQANTLDAIFHSLARRASTAEYVDQLDRYLRLGLRAQAQCARTLEVLGELKNPPPVTFVQQANVAHGPQQVVNNGATTGTPAPTPVCETTISPNQLMEQPDGQRLDTRATGTAGAANSSVEAVGALYRTEDG